MKNDRSKYCNAGVALPSPIKTDSAGVKTSKGWWKMGKRSRVYFLGVRKKKTLVQKRELKYCEPEGS